MVLDKLPKQDVLRAAEIAANVLIWLGILIIAYGTISTFTGEPWRPVERLVIPVSATLTLLLTALNALMVYLGFERLNPASGVSRYVAVPVGRRALPRLRGSGLVPGHADFGYSGLRHSRSCLGAGAGHPSAISRAIRPLGCLASRGGFPYKPPHSTRGYSHSCDPRCFALRSEVHIRGG